MSQQKIVHSLDELIKLQENSYDYNFNGYDLSEVDFSSMEGVEALSRLQYGTNTIFPNSIHTQMMEKLEKGKDPGFNVKSMHTVGYTGEGITIAIIDQKQDLTHPEIKERIIHYKECAQAEEPSYHGPAVASIAIGKSCGIAPKANLFYLSTGGYHSDPLADDALRYLLEYNRTASEEKKVRFLSCSWGDELSLSDDRKKLFQELEEQGVMIFGGFWKPGQHRTAGLYRDLTKSTNDPKSYYSNESNTTKLGIPMGDRTFASKNDGYTFDHIGGTSWTFPYLAGVGACALQANPDFVKQKGWQDKLWQLMLETGVPVSKEPNANRIIQPAKLCEKMHEMYLESQKTQSRQQGRESR